MASYVGLGLGRCQRPSHVQRLKRRMDVAASPCCSLAAAHRAVRAAESSRMTVEERCEEGPGPQLRFARYFVGFALRGSLYCLQSGTT